MGRHESFKPHFENQRAKDEEKDRKKLDTHNRGMFDQASDERIDEATGKLLKPSSKIGGFDEERTEKVTKGKGEDIMGSVAGALPTNDAALLLWIAREKAKLEKKKGNKTDDRLKEAA